MIIFYDSGLKMYIWEGSGIRGNHGKGYMCASALMLDSQIRIEIKNEQFRTEKPHLKVQQ